jgi:hypothetical protein
MGRLIKWILILVLLIVIAIAGYAGFGDLSAPSRDVSKPVEIDVD